MSISEADPAAPYLDALRRIAPLIAEERAKFDRDRRLTPPVFNALADAGLFRLWLPKVLGGPELSPFEFMRVVEAAAALDGSVGWLVGNGGGMSRAGGYLPHATVRDWFEDRRTFIVAATGAIGSVKPVDGGYRVTGRWPFGSGAAHASHFMGIATEGGDPAPDKPRICCYAPRSDVEVHDTWHVSGLRGTSSSDFEMRDVFVPASRTHTLAGQEPTAPGLLYRMPSASVFAWTVILVPLGIARGGIDSFCRLAQGKTRAGTPGPMRDRETVHAMLGRVEAMHGAARALLIQAMQDLMNATDAGGERLVCARASVRTAGAHAAETACHIVDRIAAEAGAVAIFESGPLERAVRDVQAAVKHVAMGPANYNLTGRLALGLDLGNSRF